MKASIIIPYLKGLKADDFNGSFNQSDCHLITDIDLSFKENEKACDDITDKALGTKTDSKPDDSCPGKNGSYLDIK